MSNFKYKIEDGKCQLIIGQGRIVVDWKERYIHEGDEVEIPPYDFTISPTSKTFTNFSGNQKMTASWEGVDPDVKDITDLTWETSNDKIAVIRKTDKNVYIDPVVYSEIPQDNTATITAKFPNYPDVKATCTVTSTIVLPTSITLSESAASMLKNTTLDLTATVSPNTAIDSVVWEVNDSTTLSVDQTGKVTCLDTAQPGSVSTVTCKSLYDPTVSAECSITVISQ